MEQSIIPAKGDIYRGCERKLYVAAGKEFYGCVEAVAHEMNVSARKDRNAVFLIVAAIAKNGVLVLQAVESRSARMCTLAERSDEVAVFSKFTNYSFLDRARKIQESLEAQSDDWFDQLGSEIPYNPEYLLCHYLRRNEIDSAARLAHCLLGHLALKPTRNAGQIFRIIKYLNRHRGKSKFQAAIVHGLQKLAHYTNELADRQNEQYGRISNSLRSLHFFLSGGHTGRFVPCLETFPDGFTYTPGVGFTSQLL